MAEKKGVGIVDLFGSSEPEPKRHKKIFRKMNTKRSPGDKKREEICSRDTSGMTQLNAMQCIVELLNLEGGFTDDFMEIADKFLTIITDKQDVSKIQAVFISVLVERAASLRSYSMSSIAEMFCRPTTFVLQYIDEFKDLSKRHIILKSGSYNYDYRVPESFMTAICNNTKFVRKSWKMATPLKFVRSYGNSLVDTYEDNQLDYEVFSDDVEELIKENQDLEFVRDVCDLNIGIEDRNIFLYIIYMFCKSPEVDIRAAVRPIERLYREDWLESIMTAQNDLFEYKLIDFVCCDGFKDTSSVTLTKSARKKFLKDFPKVTQRRTPEENEQTFIVKHKDIKEKELFFPEGFDKKVDDLRQLMSIDNMEKIKKRMKEKNMHLNFCCLLYGSPGTGKTESILQIAKATKRDVLQVNISEVKSMWVGESEKNVKKIFEDYKEMSKKSKNAPILLFNEADAIINKRMDGASRAIDKMENSIQNIVLESMETMEGIMVCTTNLVSQTLDSAFERRFLYKMEFPSPDCNVREKIWKSMLPDITDDIVGKISKEFQFSGGQIENAVRRYTVEEILYGKPNDMLGKLTEICESEKLNRGTNKIGFHK